MDNVPRSKRSDIMRAVKSKGSAIEIKLRRVLWSKGFRFRRNVTTLLGKPDFALKKYHAVIFVDSCFWHGCRRHCRVPSSRKKYWIDKLERNKKRDKSINRYYRNRGWKLIRVWEHNLSKIQFEQTQRKLIEKLKK